MQGVLITAYKDPANLLELLEYFGSDFAIYLHIDKRAAPAWRLQGILQALANNPSIRHLSTRYAINWGGIQHLLAILELASKAVEEASISYIHLITGQDFPLQERTTLLDFPKSAEANNFIQHASLPAAWWAREDGGLDRISYFHLYDIFDIGRASQRDRQALAWQRKLRIRRRIPTWFPKLYGGSTYWSMSSNCVRHVVNETRKRPEILKRLRFCFCAEEIYFQTILMSSPFASTLVSNNLRYIDWSGNHGRDLPAFLDNRDVEAALASNALFARKVDSQKSESFKVATRQHWV